MKVFSEALPLGDLLVRSAEANPDRLALAFPDERRTYRELLSGAIDVARGLHALGIRRGDHVGMLMQNAPEFVEGYFGVALLGAVLVPLNARFRSAELGYVMEHAELRAILVSSRASGREDLRAILGQALPSLHDARAGEPLALKEAPLLRHIVSLHGPDGTGFVGRESFLRHAATTPTGIVEQARARVRVRDVALVLYTSGTTARPKGCLLTHEGISRGSAGRLRENVPLGERNVFWCPGPLFHIAAMQSLLGAIAIGGTFVTDYWFDATRAAALVAEHEVTSLWPWFQAVMNAMLAAPGFDPAALGRVDAIILIGAESHLRHVQALFPHALLVNGSGMSELSGYYAMSPLDDPRDARATTGGKAVSGVEVRIVDPETGADAPAGHIGEILVRGYLLMEGYFKDPERTAEAIDAEGWLHTGDLFTRDEEGHITYRGRLKDMLKVGGENVPAIEVEELLCSHPDVRLAEVVGMPDPRLDEVPVAFVELAAGSRTGADELIAWCKEKIASFKVPRAVFFKTGDAWPMSATKVNKVALRKEAAELLDRKGTGT